MSFSLCNEGDPMNALLHNLVVIWFLLGAVLVVAEFFVPGILLVFFGVSAWVVSALVACVPYVRSHIALQIAIWAVLSVALLFSLRRWLTAQLTGFTSQKEDLTKLPQECVGQHVEVVEAIAPGRAGRVMWKGTLWKAEAPREIAAGQMAEIVEQRNLVLLVK
jgi:membrane protein implicated in regulation of membrane protease activity